MKGTYHRFRRLAAALVLAALGGTVVLTTDALPFGLVDHAPAGPPGASVRAAERLLESIAVKGRAPMTGYSRDEFGDGWASVRGCDMRNRILRRDLVDVTLKEPKACLVLAGTLHDPYTGQVIQFRRGADTSHAVAVDHLYPLALAWQQGAQGWSVERREKFANDPGNLRAVDGPTNQSKGASGPGSWLPPNKSYRCQYVADFVEVTARWDLSMNPGDFQMSRRVLDQCTPGD